MAVVCGYACLCTLVIYLLFFFHASNFKKADGVYCFSFIQPFISSFICPFVCHTFWYVADLMKNVWILKFHIQVSNPLWLAGT